MRIRAGAWIGVSAAIVLVALALSQVSPAQANITKIALHSRSCGTVTAFATYDGFSEGTLNFYAVFAVDLNNDGSFGDAGEPIQYVKLVPSGQAELIGTHLRFPPLPEGSTIAVTSYEIDSAGVRVSKQLPPVEYKCEHRPALDKLPENVSPSDIPDVGIVAKINRASVVVYTFPSWRSQPLGGLGRGAFVNALARNQRGDWIEINFKGKMGWIMWETQTIMLGPYTSLPTLPNAENYTPTPIPPTPTP